ncbi:MAG: thioredoxin domain-containing protein [Caldilineaceae bacterium]
MRVEPEIKKQFVAAGLVNLLFSHVLDHGTSSHMAHRAAECAGQQDPLAFWQLHDLLFERQGQLWNPTSELLVGWAGELGLDPTAMASCLEDPATAALVERIDQERRDRGIRLRPTFEINERLVEGAIAYERFVQVFAEFGVEPVNE